jgi:hypothetical protein
VAINWWPETGLLSSHIYTVAHAEVVLARSCINSIQIASSRSREARRPHTGARILTAKL